MAIPLRSIAAGELGVKVGKIEGHDGCQKLQGSI